jgi:hypothetical protein
MTKLAIIGLVLAGLAAPTAQASQRDDYGQGGGMRFVGQMIAPDSQQAKAVRACLHGPVFAPGRNATLCGPRVFRNGITVWYRDPASGTIVPIPGGKWRTEDGR